METGRQTVIVTKRNDRNDTINEDRQAVRQKSRHVVIVILRGMVLWKLWSSNDYSTTL